MCLQFLCFGLKALLRTVKGVPRWRRVTGFLSTVYRGETLGTPLVTIKGVAQVM